jgi:hypothetical protein
MLSSALLLIMSVTQDITYVVALWNVSFQRASVKDEECPHQSQTSCSSIPKPLPVLTTRHTTSPESLRGINTSSISGSGNDLIEYPLLKASNVGIAYGMCEKQSINPAIGHELALNLRKLHSTKF